ncbi:MAG: Holliday junction branch migration protein RuvA [Bacteroidales bacterium]|jgi:Holliday junction DNA helicase RuvA|nr:Holliday junction branch migration protein RuvA [Bacteroidales bacterium]
MITYLKGRLVEKTPTYLVVETAGGVAYMVHISLNTYDKVLALEEAKIYTHYVIKEDAHALYGFFDEQERSVFRLLITVNGIGPNTARVILSSMGVEQTVGAIAAGNDAAFKSVKGIGAKTAQRLIIDLKDKIGKESVQNIDKITISYNNNRNEALSALVSLGFVKKAVETTLDKIIKSEQGELSTEDLIKKALKML